MKGMLEVLGDAMLIAFGVVLIYIFVVIEVLGMYGAEDNTIIRWVEMIMGLPLIALGINRLIGDMKKK